MAYNPYNAYKKIVSAKGDWHTARQLGNDPNQYYQAAIPYYQELFDNGYEGLASELAKSDYTTAKGLRDKYGLKTDDQLKLDETIAGMTGSRPPAFDTGDATADKLLSLGTGYSDTYDNLLGAAQNIATGQQAPALSPAVQNLYDQWTAGDDRLNGEIRYDENGNVISGLNTAHYNTGREQLDRINNFDVTAQPYYEGIMRQYQMEGQNAANGEYASGAASNGGNIDSYAAANANRQQLAFTNAGQQAALQAAQQNAQNWQTLYSQMSQDLNNQGVINASTLAQVGQLYQTEAQERMNALDTAGAMEQQRMANAVNAYLAKIADDTQRYGIDAQTAMNTENNKAALEQLIASLASQERMNTENNATQRYGYDTQERMNAENNATQRYGYDTTAATAKYQTDADVAMNAANNATQRYGYDTTAATARYQTDAQQAMNAANNASALDQILAQIQGNKDIAGINNAAALEQINAQIQGQKDLAGINNDFTKEQQEWLLSMGYTTDSKGNLVRVDGEETAEETDVLPMQKDLSAVITQALQDVAAGNSTPDEAERAVKWYDLNTYGGQNTKYIENEFDRYKKLAPKASSGNQAVENWILNALDISDN